MDAIETTIEGTLQPDGTLVLDSKPNLSPGRVTVVLRQEVQAPLPQEGDWFEFLMACRKRMEEAGCRFMNDEEVQAHVDWLRESDQIDDLLRQSEAEHRNAGAALMLVYCDSVILIYFFDHIGHFNMRATNRLAALAAAKDRIAFTDLVRLEYRIAPLRNNDALRLAIFDAFCIRPDVQLLPITKAVFDRATAIRAAFNFKLGDSLHLAAAVEGGCDRFLTNDNRLSRFTDILVEVLP